MTTQAAGDETSTIPYRPGLDGVPAGESAICQVDEGDLGLRYRGYPIGDLAEQGTFEETAYLLLFGELPGKKESADFAERLRAEWSLPPSVEAFLDLVPSTAHPMDVLRTGISQLGMVDRDVDDGSHQANLRKSIRLLAQTPEFISAVYRRTHGLQRLHPRTDLSFAANLLYLLTGRQGDAQADAMARVLDISLILYAEHEFNASTFAARVTASTLTDLHAAVTSAIGTLKGPLHGGANEAVAAMLMDVGSPDRAEPWVRTSLAEKRRVMGFGHRVLKKGDPRSLIIQREAERLSRLCENRRWYDTAVTIDRIMQSEKALYPNLDFYTAVAYLLMDIPRELYTPVFVCSRMSGWCAHVIEQQDHNRLMRPRALYTGPPARTYVSLDRRG
ncbi:MAG: citrate synthase [Nitrospiraceae bacterium]